MVPNLMIFRSGLGKPNCASKVRMSFWMVGEPYESTITMVFPAPVIRRPVAWPLYSGFRSYATRYCTGV